MSARKKRDKERVGLERGRRRSGVRDPKPRVLIVTDGEVTEVDYFEHLRKQLSGLLIKVVAFEDSVAKLVRVACDRKKESDDGGQTPYRAAYVVTDVDNSLVGQLRKAQSEADDGDVRLVLSNPCFEVWLLSYREKVPESFTEIAACQDRAAGFGLTTGQRNKHIVFAELGDDHRKAVENAKKLQTEDRRALRERLDRKDFAPWTDVASMVEELLDMDEKARSGSRR